MIRLSDRLNMLTALVSKGNILADIGCDHAYTDISLVERGICPKAFAMDLREGPLAAAAENVKNAGLSDRIELRLSNGLDKLNEREADTIFISGMGGRLICDILSAKPEVAHSAKELILSPQSEIEWFEKWLSENEYRVTKKTICSEDDKFYFGYRVVTERDKNQTGSFPAAEPKDVYRSYLMRELKIKHDVCTAIKDDDGEKAVARRNEIYNDIRRIEDEINSL